MPANTHFCRTRHNLAFKQHFDQVNRIPGMQDCEGKFYWIIILCSSVMSWISALWFSMLLLNSVVSKLCRLLESGNFSKMPVLSPQTTMPGDGGLAPIRFKGPLSDRVCREVWETLMNPIAHCGHKDKTRNNESNYDWVTVPNHQSILVAFS